jgi:uncharacterized protein
VDSLKRSNLVFLGTRIKHSDKTLAMLFCAFLKHYNDAIGRVEMGYYKFSDFLKKEYGEKVYKIPVNLPVSCPNRECGGGGCIFCGDEGADFEMLESSLSVKEQIRQNGKFMKENYHASKFIVYFQNYSNTYIQKEKLQKYIEEILEVSVAYNIVGLYISTRPDCISDNYLEMIKNTVKESLDIVIELGLQTANYKTLEILNRGHSLGEFIDSVIRIKKVGFGLCAHVILDLPFDEMVDVQETAKILSALSVDQVKCHSLYVLEDTKLAEMVKENEITLLTFDDYVERALSFLEFLSPHIVVQRIIGRAPKERTLFCNFGMSWWKIHDAIVKAMEEEDRFQGKKFDYLNGKALGKFKSRK